MQVRKERNEQRSRKCGHLGAVRGGLREAGKPGGRSPGLVWPLPSSVSPSGREVVWTLSLSRVVSAAELGGCPVALSGDTSSHHLPGWPSLWFPQSCSCLFSSSCRALPSAHTRQLLASTSNWSVPWGGLKNDTSG